MRAWVLSCTWVREPTPLSCGWCEMEFVLDCFTICGSAGGEASACLFPDVGPGVALETDWEVVVEVE